MKDTENIIGSVLHKYNCGINFKVQKQKERKKIPAFFTRIMGATGIATGF